jgi:predicted Zn-dependent protease
MAALAGPMSVNSLLSAAVAALALVCAVGGVRAQSPAQSVGDLMTPPASPTPLEEVQKLLASGQPQKALNRADDHLAKNPRDAQMRFVRGVILTELKDPAAARSVFQQLTEDFPELPEPYNNLAVLYAADGQLDRARAALEMALTARPDYATAHENLGDVYLQMAADSYQRAATLQPGNRALSAKLSLSRELVSKTRSR